MSTTSSGIHFEQHCKYFSSTASPFVEVEAAPTGLNDSGIGVQLSRRFHPVPLAGSGWIDMYAFGHGITVSRMDCRLAQPRIEQHQDFSDGLRLNLLLNGPDRIYDHKGQPIQNQAGDVLVRHDDPGPLSWRLPAGSHQVGVALDVPRSLLRTLVQQGGNLSHFGAAGTCTVLRPRLVMRQYLRSVATRMLTLQAGISLLARLELESLALELLLRLLHADTEWHNDQSTFARGKPVPARWQAAVDEAVDIVQTHRGQPLTIAQLARRVGINECYLKELFRLRTGSTIAAYQRKQRMQHARELIESGQCTVQRAALDCGYTRTDKFAEAFVRAHGISPSALARL